MNPLVVSWAIWISIAFGAAVFAIVALVTASKVRSSVLRMPATPLLLWTIGLGVLIGTALSGRTFEYALGMGVGDIEARASASWVGRFLNLGSVTLAAAVILERCTHPKDIGFPRSPLVIGFCVYFLLSIVLGSIMGTRPAFLHSLFYAPLLLFAVSLDRQLKLESFVVHAKYVLLTILAVSAVAAVATPRLAIEHGYHGFIPLIEFRLHGLVGHANVLGPIALVYLLFELWAPSRWFVRFPAVGLACIELLLSQSKTTWIAGVAVGGLLMVRLWWPKKDEWLTPSASTVVSVVSLFAGAAALLVLAWIGVYAFESGAFASGIGSQRLQELSSFTGRTRIWEITLAVWEENPWFGYGPMLWSPEMRLEYRLFVAGQAHNQYLQTLGDSGLVGLLGLGVYLLTMIWAGIKGAATSRWITIGLVIILLFRSMTESPLRNGYIMDAGFLLHMIVFAALLLTTQSHQGPNEESR